MSRYRLYPSPAQEQVMREHCAHARFVWNLCVEQDSWYRTAWGPMPGYVQRCAQLTEARAESPWLAAGSVIVQQQAIRDFGQAMARYFACLRGEHEHPAGACGKPSWRRKHRSEGFRVVAVKPRHIRKLNAGWGEVLVPKAGMVRFRWSRAVPEGVKSLRVTLDAAGRWHVAFAVIPAAVAGPGTGEVVGVDRGVAVSAALSTGQLLHAPRLSPGRAARLRLLQRRLARAKRGSNRRARVRRSIARLHAREVDARRDWCEKVSTDLARRFDVIRVEDLDVTAMTRSARGTVAEPGRNVAAKAGPNRGILASGWGYMVARLEDKAPGRVEKISAAYTSQRCSACGHVDSKSRQSQAVFCCTACGYACNADVNAARNIALGRRVNARGGDRVAGPANREPQLPLAS